MACTLHLRFLIITFEETVVSKYVPYAYNVFIIPVNETKNSSLYDGFAIKKLEPSYSNSWSK